MTISISCFRAVTSLGRLRVSNISLLLSILAPTRISSLSCFSYELLECKPPSSHSFLFQGLCHLHLPQRASWGARSLLPHAKDPVLTTIPLICRLQHRCPKLCTYSAGTRIMKLWFCPLAPSFSVSNPRPRTFPEGLEHNVQKLPSYTQTGKCYWVEDLNLQTQATTALASWSKSQMCHIKRGTSVLTGGGAIPPNL